MPELHDFYPATQKEISDIISDITIKTSPADPVPALLLKEIIEDLIPHIQNIVNAFLLTGSTCLKTIVQYQILNSSVR